MKPMNHATPSKVANTTNILHTNEWIEMLWRI